VLPWLDRRQHQGQQGHACEQAAPAGLGQIRLRRAYAAELPRRDAGGARHVDHGEAA
jgi:hypothetical protein